MLRLHRSNRADLLVGELGVLLGRVPEDPFVREVVAVPTAGVERWLAQSLSLVLGARGGRRDGVVANVGFPTPRAVVERAIGQAVGADPAVDPWAAERLVWPLLAVVDEHLDEPWLAVLARHLRETAGEGGVARRLGSVRHLARLFDGYAIHRPGMVRAWASGSDVDGSGRALAPTVAWQAELWRRVAARIGVPGPETRTDEAVARLRSDAAAVDLPDRLALFGLTRLPPAHLEVLDALATHREVHLFLLHPSPALWDRLAQAPAPTSPCRTPAVADGAPCNRLLGSWGRDTRELQQVLRGVPDAEPAAPSAGTSAADVTVGAAASSYSAPRPLGDATIGDPGAGSLVHRRQAATDASRATSLLHHLQADIAADAPAPGPPAPGAPDPRPPLAPGDRSVQVHACHGRARQVEVLRDAILHELAADPTLEPRDVIVLCPDIEQFAPLVRATFGAVPGGADGAPDLRLRLADRALRQTNPVLGTIDRVLELAGGRLTAPDVLDLADRPPVRERFGLTDDDLARAGEWVAEAQVRWGLDAAHRGQAGLEQVGANTWRRGLDRVLLGVATTEDAHVLLGDALPLDDVGSTEIDLAGRLAELLDRLDDVVARFAIPRTLDAWADELARAADLLCAVPDADAWQRSALDGLLQDRVAESGGPGGSTSPLALAELRDLLADHLRGRPSRANFRTGHLTVCTMQPMRSVPHRVVCLLGLDDGAFPRAAARDGDDLLLADPHVGDPDPRSEDRQLLLDALLSAEDRLIVTYGGADERTNARRPPAVPVGELLDAVDATVRVDPHGDATRTARDVIVTEHPLQPFDPRTFRDGALGTDGPFGFDRVALAGARALEAQRAAGPPTGGGRPFLATRLPPATDEEALDLEALDRFLRHPVRAFLRQRLGVTLPRGSEELPGELPIALDGLGQWAVGDRLVRAIRRGVPWERAVEAERARGALPPGALGTELLETLRTKSRFVTDAATAVIGPPVDRGSVDVRVALPDGRTLAGTVADLRMDDGAPGPAVLESVSYSRLGPKHRLAAWVRLLALTAARPDQPYEAVTIGRLRDGGKKDLDVSVSRIPSPGGDDPAARRAAALEALMTLVDLRDRGMREPPPLWCATSHAYVAHGPRTKPAASAAKAWKSGFMFDSEDRDAEHQLVHGGVVPYDRLAEEVPRGDESGPGWDDGETTRAGRWARRLWTPLRDAEELTDR